MKSQKEAYCDLKFNPYSYKVVYYSSNPTESSSDRTSYTSIFSLHRHHRCHSLTYMWRIPSRLNQSDINQHILQTSPFIFKTSTFTCLNNWISGVLIKVELDFLLSKHISEQHVKDKKANAGGKEQMITTMKSYISTQSYIQITRLMVLQHPNTHLQVWGFVPQASSYAYQTLLTKPNPKGYIYIYISGDLL